jgi:biotin carboxylase
VAVRLHLIGSKPTDSVIRGFVPAAVRLGLEVLILTDQPREHERALGDFAGARFADTPSADTPSADTVRVAACDPWDPRALIARIAALGKPDAVFTNSDHLQAQTALAADYLGLPGKDWRSALRAKDKSLMRRRLAETGTERVASAEITADTVHPVTGLPYPVVLKPAEGVASEDVVLVFDAEGLGRHSAAILARRPGERLVAEQFLPGTLRTLETISDGVTTWVLGGFRTDLSDPPYFIEERLTWDAPGAAAADHVLGALGELGVSFGPCHTEFVTGPGGQAALVEVNDRLIGDYCDFLLSDLLGTDLFELTLRLYLGERLPAAMPPAPRGCAVIDYVVAQRSGTLTAAPAAVGGGPVWYRPWRQPGDEITLTHTNRDYLGAISAIGPDLVAAEATIAAFRAGHQWLLSPGHSA